MADQKKPYTFDRVVRMVLTTLALVAVFFMLRYLSDVLVPFVVAAVLAYFINPVVVIFQERLGLNRGPAVGLAMGTATLIGFGIVLIMSYLTLEQVHRFDDQWRALRADASEWINATAERDEKPEDAPTSQPGEEKTILGLTELYDALSDFTSATDASIGTRLENLTNAVRGTYTETVLNAAARFMNKNDDLKLIVNAAYKQLAAGGLTITNFAVQAFVVVSLVIIIILYLIFLLLDFPQYQRDWKGFLPPTYREGILEFGAEFDVILRKYFRGQFIVAALTGISFAIGFSIVGLPMAVPFGLFVGLLNIVPYMQLLAIPPAFLLVLIDYLSGNCDLVWSSLYVAIVFGVVQLLQDGVFVPQIMGKAVGLSPVAILLGIFIWGKLLGFLGLLLAIPLTCLGIAYYRRFVLHLSKDEDPVTAATKAMQTAPAEVESKLTPAADITPPAPKKDKKKG